MDAQLHEFGCQSAAALEVNDVPFGDNRNSEDPKWPTQRLMRLILVPSILKLAIKPCWSEMKA